MLDPAARDKLQQLAQETLAELAAEVCDAGRASAAARSTRSPLAGNATMVHLVLGIDPEPLGVAPFIMAARLLPEVRARDLGVPAHPRARAVVFPAFGAYVGGDITAGLLASGMDRDPRIRLFIDIGTNCEIVLGGRDWLLATAAPAGPAFEGASIRCGMRAADGAIEAVAITEDGDLKLTVIGDTEPPACAAPASSTRSPPSSRPASSTSSGRFVADEDASRMAPGLADRLTMIGEERVFVLHGSARPRPGHSVYLSQRDVRELQFAKAAIATGWRILLEEAGLDRRRTSSRCCSRASSAPISAAKSAIRIGLVPDVRLRRIVAAGNVAGEGAKMALLSVRERAAALALLEEVRYVELSDRADFNDRFIDQLGFS